MIDRDLLDRLHGDRRGTAMTEFVITLPIFVLIFVGLVELGKLARTSVYAHEQSKLKTVRKFLEVQSGSADNFEQVVGNAAAGAGAAAHLHPTAAGTDATNQLKEDPPRRPTAAQQGVVSAYETNTYARMATGGHLGEATARLQPTVYSGDFGPRSVTDVLQTPERSLFGADPNGQVVGFDLFSDRLSTPPKGGDCRDLLALLTDRVNRLLSQSGSRAMLAAGIRYGTVTGRLDETVDVAGRPVEVSTYWNTLVPPHVFEGDGNLQTAMSTYITRLALKTCGRAPYNRLLGISRGSGRSDILGMDTGNTVDRRLPAVEDGFELKVPDPYPGGNYDEVGFHPPLLYRGRGLRIDYETSN